MSGLSDNYPHFKSADFTTDRLRYLLGELGFTCYESYSPLQYDVCLRRSKHSCLRGRRCGCRCGREIDGLFRLL